MNASLRNRKVLVVGLARSGLAAANLLLAQGARVRITDLRDAAALATQLGRLQGPVESTLGRHREEDFTSADLIVVSPGVRTDHPCLQAARSKGVAVWAEVELGFRQLQGEFIGITGSNGKTTTTALVGELFRTAGMPAAVAGNIGRPLTELALESLDCRRFVVELSSFQLENIHEFRCTTAVILNLTADHLDRHSGFPEYAAAKERIFNRQGPRDHAVLNADDGAVRAMAGRRDSEVFFFNRRQQVQQGACLSEAGWVTVIGRGHGERVLPAGEIRLKGLHNLENVLAAATVGHLSGVSAAAMAECFRSFAGVEHRLEYVAEVNQVEFFNDSKATNVDSAAKALEAFNRPLVVILGGRNKGGDFRTLLPLLQDRARAALLIGEAASEFKSLLSATVPCTLCASLESAVEEALQRAHPGDAVLLAPACASFDMFENFEHRGRVFKETVARLKRRREGVGS